MEEKSRIWRTHRFCPELLSPPVGGGVLGVCALSRVQLFATPWTVAHQAPLFMGFPRQEYWSGLPFPAPGYLPDPGIEPVSLASLP